MTPEEIEAVKADWRRNVVAWRADPVKFVRDVFGAEPDAWQADALHCVRDGKRTALVACKGPGKSCLEAWAIWWLLVCHRDAQGIALSITGDNLRDGLWKELAFWRSKSPLISQAFEINAERIYSVSRPKTWWCSARSFAQAANREEQANSLAGLHAAVVFVVLDEIGDYPPGVLPAAEGIFAVDGAKARLLAGGNPTSTDGPLYRICTVDREMWQVLNVTGDPDDPKRSTRISIEWAGEQIRQWGRDNPWVRANVLGEFPLAGTDKLISLDDVLAAQKRDTSPHAYRSEPIIWGIDPSYSERGDEIALARRQGLLCRRFITWRGMDGVLLAEKIAGMIIAAQGEQQEPDAIFVDIGGGGSTVVSHLRFLGYGDMVQTVDFGGPAHDPRFENRRVEMWWSMAEWFHRFAPMVPSDPVLQAELIAPTYTYETVNKRTVLRVESKKKMKARGIPSPNRADALALTWAQPMAPLGKHARESQLHNTKLTMAVMRQK